MEIFWASILFLQFCYNLECYGNQFRRPQIATTKRSITLNTGSNYNLECYGYHKLYWITPKVPIYQEDWTQMSSELSNPNHRMDRYHSTLSITNISYAYTGYFTCTYSHMIIINKTIEEKSKPIYISVRDKKHISVSNTLVLFVQENSTVIPCRPTFPQVNVILNCATANTVVHIKSKGLPRSSYDYKTGFIIKRNSCKSKSSCTYSFGDIKFTQNIIFTKKDGKDLLIYPHVSALYAEENSTISLNCAHSDTEVCIYWLQPEIENTELSQWTINCTNKSAKHLNECPFTEHGLGCKHSITFSISSVKLENSQTYACLGYKKSTIIAKSIDVKIVPVLRPFIQLKPKDGISAIIQEAYPGSSVVFTIQFQSYPRGSIYWFNNKQEYIQNNAHQNVSKYVVLTSADESHLIIQNLTLEDNGNYIVLVKNGIEEKTYIFELDVILKPILNIINRHPYRFLNSTFKTLVTIISNPLPDINCIFLMDTCTNTSLLSRNCKTTKPSNIQIRPLTKYSKVFTFTFTALYTGVVTCEGKHLFGITKESIPIYVTDTEEETALTIIGIPKPIRISKSIFRIDAVFNSTTILTCAGAKDEFSFVIWKYQENIIFSNGHYMLKNTSTKFTIRLTLTITNLDPRIDRGLYTCEGLSLNKKNVKEKKIILDIHLGSRPAFIYTNLNNGLQIVHPHLGMVELECIVSGIPQPNIQWLKDGKELFRKSIQRSGNGQKLYFANFTKEDIGNYTCIATNSEGSVTRYDYLAPYGPNHDNYPLFVTLLNISVIPGIIFLITISYCIVRRKLNRRANKKRKNETENIYLGSKYWI